MTQPATPFTLYPALDVRAGRCVRLERGAVERERVYSEDPLRVARGFAEAGAEWIHLVDLDAAFGEGSNRALIRELVSSLPLRVQTGGGLRSEGDVQDVLDAGAARVVLGTAALEHPELVMAAVERWGPERIVVGLDARGRRPALRGWREEAPTDLFEVGASLVHRGVRTLIYTDIDRDGMLAGPNLEMAAELAARTGAEVIVSGGVGALADLQAIAAAAEAGQGIVGAIVGKALYEGKVDLAEALALGRR
ncbi:MAG TPA: 1-(5-phosphoribosyl)-5-[(5-phosphoribosylamino)methylideneamino]imidazole-4-carboxamide isomerase [Longimicrobiaceae bacterium]|nr:1-(5-phosphoribosyl)-5-[(5-phosphoribosylamino)methylideneamino]imidazole-4-carboxamide isomerase [Longimicrobiaceae bacterium]